MGCDFPLKAYLTGQQHPSGKSLITFNRLKSLNSQLNPMEIPCNNCMGCKLERSRQWSIRMMHEARYHPQNCFLTLTYDNQHVPQNFGLDLRHWQLFMKKLRRSLTQKIRFFACGEYGDENGRPHYHAIIFNYDPPDRVFLERSSSGEPIYSSETLSRIWNHGLVSTQDVTHKSCAYVARYVTKKIKTGDDFGAGRYHRLSPIDGAFHDVRPEFAVMSRNPGLGTKYVEEFKSDFYPSGYIVVNGVRQSPPRFYISKLSEKEQTRLKRQARRLGLKNKPHQTTERRMARAAVRDARIKKLQRKI
ncbi:replication initiator protein [Blackfly microvirus SF02]|uniref:Replication initiator protein n=1 Tax=Blackfly microvirus SF02 TaxID=2576452 RepID=A0A4P8PTH6_9VIRU|nr:replication initiator protein [Blackfly microvirus SF02]